MTALRSARAAVAFLTPVGGAADPSPGAVLWFPHVGAVLGAVLGLTWVAAGEVWTPLVAAAVVVAVDLLLTGMLHLDGLADSADGLLPHLPSTARRLEVMAQPDIGAFGTGVVATTLLLRFACLAAIGASIALPAALWCLSRTVMGITLTTVRYARPGGLATAFTGTPAAAVAAPGFLLAVLLAAAWRPVQGPVAVVAGGVAAACVVLLARRRVGGFTGDVLGAAGLVGETVGLLVAAGRWR